MRRRLSDEQSNDLQIESHEQRRGRYSKACPAGPVPQRSATKNFGSASELRCGRESLRPRNQL